MNEIVMLELEPKRESEVKIGLKYLEDEISRAAMLQDNIRNILGCVLRNDTSCDEKRCATSEEPKLTLLTTQIHDSVNMLKTISDGYEDMLSRIDL